jgi:hypothetical protein
MENKNNLLIKQLKAVKSSLTDMPPEVEARNIGTINITVLIERLDDVINRLSKIQAIQEGVYGSME